LSRYVTFGALAAFVVSAVLETAVVAQQKPQTGSLPPIKRLGSAKAVVDEHLDAINKCDWTRLMAQYPPEVQFFLPGGQVVKGREAVGELFRNFVKPVKEGGLCGMKFETENSFAVGDTINVQWVAKADFLAEPYRGADAYVTKDGLMWAQVTTFDGAQIKKK
jgi:SnoaL-like domain